MKLRGSGEELPRQNTRLWPLVREQGQGKLESKVEGGADILGHSFLQQI